MKASVIIPVYNNLKHMILTLNSLREQSISKEDFEVIICDDGSHIDMETPLEQYKKDLNISYKYQEDLGFRAGTARNMGIKDAKGEVCIFIDSGILASSNFIKEHLESHNEDSKKDRAIIGYVYGFDNLNSFKEDLESTINLNNIDNSCELLHKKGIFDMREEVYRDMGEDMSSWPAPWCYFWSLNISVKKNRLIEVGMFDEYHTTWGGEDVDLGIALYKAGVDIQLNKKAKAIDYPHDKVHSMSNDFDSFVNKLIEKRTYLLKKYKMDEIKVWIELLDTKKLNRYLLDNEEWKTKY